MPRGVVYDTFTEAQEYADRVNGEPMEVEGGFSVVSPLGYSDGGKAIPSSDRLTYFEDSRKKPVPIEPKGSAVDLLDKLLFPKGFKGTF